MLVQMFRSRGPSYAKPPVFNSKASLDVSGPVDPRDERGQGAGRSQQTSRPEDRHIVRNARVQPTASSAAIQAQVLPSLWAPVSSRTTRVRLTEGHFGSRRPLRALPFTPTHLHLRLDCGGMEPGRL
ncbi:HTH_Tnp_Tc3_2 domain-containing protein [Trichonephila clavipes]|nr:HTH_Tnp_Tc3_2 domain-containing protein [Trichonephila clavipes]